MQPETAIVHIEEPVAAGLLLAQDIALRRIYFCAHRVGLPLHNRPAQEPLAFLAALDPDFLHTLTVASESLVGDIDSVGLYEVESPGLKMIKQNRSRSKRSGPQATQFIAASG